MAIWSNLSITHSVYAIHTSLLCVVYLLHSYDYVLCSALKSIFCRLIGDYSITMRMYHFEIFAIHLIMANPFWAAFTAHSLK